MRPSVPKLRNSHALLGIACGAGAALFWALGLAIGRHGILIGFAPADIVFHRFVWAGLVFLPFFAQDAVHSIGWRKSVWLTLAGGPLLAFFSYAGFLFVPLAHGGVIQPACSAVGGLLLARLMLAEKLPAQRVAGAAVILLGLCVIGGEALATLGLHGVSGDLLFATAGLFFAVFATLVRKWRIAPLRAVAVTAVVSLAGIPIYWAAFGFGSMIAQGFWENLLQALGQGIFGGAGAVYLFTQSVVRLGVARAAVFPSLVPGFALLLGPLLLGEMPSALQLIGFAIVLVGFRFAQKP
ncbi:MAG TPA: DMT family transporter [Xanthobacteraceae bacterium]